jgi:putative abortive infection protein
MLINFSFGNFRSFRAVKSLRMEAVQIKELSDSVIERDGFRLLPTAVLYGANSSGKTNVIMALGLFRNIVDKNIKLNPGEDLVYDPFLLDDCSKNEPTTFEIQCLFEGAVYRYGFEYTKNTIISEWLYEKKIGPGAKEHYLFRRERQTFSVSATYFSEGKGKESSTTENRLFLSLVAQLNGRIAQKLIKHLSDYNAISGLKDDGYERLMIDMLKKHLRGCDEAIDFFRRLDLGFTNIEIEERDIPNDLKETLATLPIISNDKFNNAKVIETLTTHNVYDAEGKVINTVRFDADDKESNGTNKVITLSGPIFDTLLGGKVLFVDELDSKLHPMMTRAIVRLFMDKETNPHGAQLVFTTHDTHLLDTKYLRRDQVWFTEKDPTEASDLYSLLDFKVRNDRDIENDYINGRYGAIPFIK